MIDALKLLSLLIIIYIIGYALCRRPRSLLIALGLQILGIVASGSWHPWYPDLSFGMLGGLTLAPWMSLGRSWDIGEHNKGHFEVQARIPTILGGCRDPILTVVEVPWTKKSGHGCHLACMAPLLWRLGTAWDDPRAILGHWGAIRRALCGPCMRLSS